MKPMLKTFAGATCLCLIATGAMAQGVQVVTEEGVLGGVRRAIAQNAPGLLSANLQPTWERLRTAAEAKLRDDLGRPDRFFRGVTLYGITCNLSPVIRDVTFQPMPGSIRMRYRLQDNYVKAKSTTPGPLGSYADPTFEIHFDASFLVEITYPGSDLRFKAGPTTVTIENVRFDSQGFVADVAMLVNDLLNLFTRNILGKSVLIAAVEARSHEFTLSTDGMLDRVNRTLRDLASNRFDRKGTVYDPRTRTVIVTMFKQKDLSLDGARNDRGKVLQGPKKKKVSVFDQPKGSSVTLNPQPLPPKQSPPKPKGLGKKLRQR